MAFNYDAVNHITNQNFARCARNLKNDCEELAKKYNERNDLKGCCKDARVINEFILRYLYDRLVGSKGKEPMAGTILRDSSFTSAVTDVTLLLAAQDVQKIGSIYSHPDKRLNETVEQFETRKTLDEARLEENADIIMEKLSVVIAHAIDFINKNISDVQGSLTVEFGCRTNIQSGNEESYLLPILKNVGNSNDFVFSWYLKGNDAPLRENLQKNRNKLFLDQEWMVDKTFVVKADSKINEQSFSCEYGPVKNEEVITGIDSTPKGKIVIRQDITCKEPMIQLKVFLEDADFTLNDKNVSIIWNFINHNGRIIRISKIGTETYSTLKCPLEKSLGVKYRCEVHRAGFQQPLVAEYRPLTEKDFALEGAIKVEAIKDEDKLKCTVFFKKNVPASKCQYRWFRNGNEIKDSNKPEISISTDDIGARYVCRVSVPEFFTEFLKSKPCIVKKSDIKKTLQGEVYISKDSTYDGAGVRLIVFSRNLDYALYDEGVSIKWNRIDDNGGEKPVFNQEDSKSYTCLCSLPSSVGHKYMCTVSKNGTDEQLSAEYGPFTEEDFAISGKVLLENKADEHLLHAYPLIDKQVDSLAGCVYKWFKDGVELEEYNQPEVSISDEDIGAVYTCEFAFPDVFTGSLVSEPYTVKNIEEIEENIENVEENDEVLKLEVEEKVSEPAEVVIKGEEPLAEDVSEVVKGKDTETKKASEEEEVEEETLKEVSELETDSEANEKSGVNTTSSVPVILFPTAVENVNETVQTADEETTSEDKNITRKSFIHTFSRTYWFVIFMGFMILGTILVFAVFKPWRTKTENTGATEKTNEIAEETENLEENTSEEQMEFATTEDYPSYTSSEIDAGVLGDTIVFNSISDGKFGNEKKFLNAKLLGSENAEWEFLPVKVTDGEVYTIRMYVHNDNPDSTNAIAEDVRVSFDLPVVVAKQLDIKGKISSSNSQPKEYQDKLTFLSDDYFYFKYVDGSATFTNDEIGTIPISNSVITSGVPIGEKLFDGKIPGGCDGIVTIDVEIHKSIIAKVDMTTRMKGTESWDNVIWAKNGDEVEFRIEFENFANFQVENVMLRVVMPDNLEYVNGTTTLTNYKYPDTVIINDTPEENITTNGINIGDYFAFENAYVTFTTKVVNVDALDSDSVQLVNWASATIWDVDTMVYKDDASVMVTK